PDRLGERGAGDDLLADRRAGAPAQPRRLEAILVDALVDAAQALAVGGDHHVLVRGVEQLAEPDHPRPDDRDGQPWHQLSPPRGRNFQPYLTSPSSTSPRRGISSTGVPTEIVSGSA